MTVPHSLRSATYLLLAICGSLLLSPRVVTGAEASAHEVTALPPVLPAEPAVRVEPAPPLAAPCEFPRRTSHRSACLCDACGMSWWLVSSREASRHPHEGFDSDLQFFHYRGRQRTSQGTCRQFQSGLTPGVPIVIFVHGSFVSFNDNEDEAVATAQWLRQLGCSGRVQFVGYTWPSDGPYTVFPAIETNRRGRWAEFNGLHLARLIDALPPGCPICLIGHSHGSRVICAAAHLRGGGEVFDVTYRPATQRRLRLILVAAAIDKHWLDPGERLGRAVPQAESVVLLKNRYDIALNAYKFRCPFSRGAASVWGLIHREDLQSQAARIREIDVADQIGILHAWPFYLRYPSIGRALVPYFVSW